jgi:hypothetical protein
MRIAVREEPSIAKSTDGCLTMSCAAFAYGNDKPSYVLQEVSKLIRDDTVIDKLKQLVAWLMAYALLAGLLPIVYILAMAMFRLAIDSWSAGIG